MSTKVEQAILALTKDVGELTGEMRANTINQDKVNEQLAKLLEKHEKRDDKIEGKADAANEEIKAAKNKVWGIAIGSGIGGGGIGTLLAKIFA